MPIKLNPKEIEEARKRPLRKERQEQQRQIMLEDIDRNRSGKGAVVIPPPVKQTNEAIGCQKQRVAAYVRVSTQEEEQQEQKASVCIGGRNLTEPVLKCFTEPISKGMRYKVTGFWVAEAKTLCFDLNEAELEKWSTKEDNNEP